MWTKKRWDFRPELSRHGLSLIHIYEYIKAVGCEKKEFATDEEAKKFASEMAFNNKDYPVVYFKSDTTGWNNKNNSQNLRYN